MYSLKVSQVNLTYFTISATGMVYRNINWLLLKCHPLFKYQTKGRINGAKNEKKRQETFLLGKAYCYFGIEENVRL